jgi:hypothetical protein
MISGMLPDYIYHTLANQHRMVKKYGIPMLITSDDNLKEYISTILAQVQGKSQFPLHPYTLLVGRQADSQNGS